MSSVNEMMYEKLRNEFDSYKDDIAQMSPYEIISKAKSVVIRENIVEAAAHAFSMDNIEPEKLAELLKETNLLGRIADVYSAYDQNPILYDISLGGTLSELLEEVYLETINAQKDIAESENKTLYKYTVEYKIDAGFDTPVPEDMDGKNLSAADIREILAEALDDFYIGESEYDDTSEPDVIRNDDGSYDVHARIYATYFADVYAYSEEEAKELAEDVIQNADFGELTMDDEFNYEFYAIDANPTDSLRLAVEIKAAAEAAETNPNAFKRFFAPNVDETQTALLVEITDVNHIEINVYESLDSVGGNMMAPVTGSGTVYDIAADNVCTNDRYLGTMSATVDTIEKVMNNFVIQELGKGQEKPLIETDKEQANIDIDM